MSDTLDLDSILPRKRTIKLNGKNYEVLPATLRDFIVIQQLFLGMQNLKDNTATMAEINKALVPVVPDIEDMNLTIDQLSALLKFVYSSSTDDTAVSTEKKTDLVEPLPTS